MKILTTKICILLFLPLLIIILSIVSSCLTNELVFHSMYPSRTPLPHLLCMSLLQAFVSLFPYHAVLVWLLLILLSCFLCDPVIGKPRFRFLKNSDEAAAAIRAVLSADPRSVYRRTRCQDRLFYFTMDTADITCWFGDGFAEVLRVQPLKL